MRRSWRRQGQHVALSRVFACAHAAARRRWFGANGRAHDLRTPLRREARAGRRAALARWLDASARRCSAFRALTCSTQLGALTSLLRAQSAELARDHTPASLLLSWRPIPSRAHAPVCESANDAMLKPRSAFPAPLPSGRATAVVHSDRLHTSCGRRYRWQAGRSSGGKG